MEAQKFEPDSTKTEKEFVEIYMQEFGYSKEIENYLRIRYRWMKGTATREECQKAFIESGLKKENIT